MFKNETAYTYSPSDLNAFLDNECVTWLDRFNLDFPGQISKDAAEEGDLVLQRSGEEHERKMLDSFRIEMDVAEIKKCDSITGLHQTMAAMRKGRSAIQQIVGELLGQTLEQAGNLHAPLLEATY
jgi:hypothetical protein